MVPHHSIEDIQEEEHVQAHEEVFEDSIKVHACKALIGESMVVSYPFPHVHEGLKIGMVEEYFLEVDLGFDSDYWRPFGDLIYDTSSEEGTDFEPFGQPCFKGISHDKSQAYVCENFVDVSQHNGDFDVDLGHLCLPSPRTSLDHHF